MQTDGLRGFARSTSRLLLAAGLWCRVTSLETAPVPSGDEAFFGTQAERLLRGGVVAGHTGSGKPVDVFYTALGAPLHGIFRPSFALERTPAVIFGVLAVLLTYALGRRILDRTTALIAAILLAVLPIAIIYSRLGWEYAEVPLLCLLVIHNAARANRIGLIVSYLAAIHVSPTTVFLLPVPLGLLAARLLDRPAREGEPSRRGADRCW